MKDDKILAQFSFLIEIISVEMKRKIIQMRLNMKFSYSQEIWGKSKSPFHLNNRVQRDLWREVWYGIASHAIRHSQIIRGNSVLHVSQCLDIVIFKRGGVATRCGRGVSQHIAQLDGSYYFIISGKLLRKEVAVCSRKKAYLCYLWEDLGGSHATNKPLYA